MSPLWMEETGLLFSFPLLHLALVCSLFVERLLLEICCKDWVVLVEASIERDFFLVDPSRSWLVLVGCSLDWVVMVNVSADWVVDTKNSSAFRGVLLEPIDLDLTLIILFERFTNLNIIYLHDFTLSPT